MKLYTGHIAWHAEVLQNRPGLPWLVMLHGFMGSGQVYKPLEGKLGRFCNPVIIDMIGHGRSSGSVDPGRYKTEKLVNDLKSILDRIRPAPFFLYGYSMGGRLALQYASHPATELSAVKKRPGAGQSEVDGLILESTTFGINSLQERKERRVQDEGQAEFIERDFAEFLSRWLDKPLFTGETGSGGEGQKATGLHERKIRYRQVMQSQNPAYLAACLRGFGTGAMPSVYDKLKTLSLPVLLLAGKQDDKFISIHRQMKEALPDARSKIIHGAAHRVHLDQPDLLLKEIETFIKQQTP